MYTTVVALCSPEFHVFLLRLREIVAGFGDRSESPSERAGPRNLSDGMMSSALGQD